MADPERSSNPQNRFQRPGCPPIEIGSISKFIEVQDIVLRPPPRTDTMGDDLDAEDADDLEAGADEAELAEDVLAFRVQAKLRNRSSFKLCDIQYDVSFYAADGTFLGLQKNTFLDEDEMDANDHLPLDIGLDLPRDAHRCVFNVRAKRAGIIGRLFWG